ncbi:hypothetical protein TNCV_327401 [Trichonephila clavipes]|nr:hypothetical protein TNCV_327401 [Trichonephila clavipes]
MPHTTNNTYAINTHTLQYFSITQPKPFGALMFIAHSLTSHRECSQGLGSNPGEGMDVCKCIVPSRHEGTLNIRRAANSLVSGVVNESLYKYFKNNLKLSGQKFQDDDRFNSCQVIYSQFGLAIHQNDHQARRRFVEWAQNEIAVVPDFHKRILFSDEAHFWLNGYINKQKCRIWSEANPQVYVETPLHPEKLTVWCALWAGGILLQKRRRPQRYSQSTISLSTGYVKSLVYADKPQTLDHLEDNILRVIADIRPQMLGKVIENWTSRLDYIRASRGSHMPEIIFKISSVNPTPLAPADNQGDGHPKGGGDITPYLVVPSLTSVFIVKFSVLFKNSMGDFAAFEAN